MTTDLTLKRNDILNTSNEIPIKKIHNDKDRKFLQNFTRINHASISRYSKISKYLGTFDNKSKNKCLSSFNKRYQ